MGYYIIITIMGYYYYHYHYGILLLSLPLWDIIIIIIVVMICKSVAAFIFEIMRLWIVDTIM